MTKIKLFFLIIVLFISCDIEEAIIEDLTPETFSNWTPNFSDQTDDFSQSRTGDKGTNETRTIIVSVDEEIINDNERNLNSDLNEDGDRVDYLQKTIFTYTASENLGSFQATSDWVVSVDQMENFANRNFGYHAANFSTSSFFENNNIGAIYYLISLGDTLDEFKIGERLVDNENDCFEMKTLEDFFSEVPYQSIQDLSGTKDFFSDDLIPDYYNVKYKMLDIDLGEWSNDDQFDGVLVDYIVEWASRDPVEYTAEVYRVSDRNEFFGNGNGELAYNNPSIGVRQVNLQKISDLSNFGFSLCE